MNSRRFQPRLWPGIAAAIGIAATVWLGHWQLDRARQKIEAAALLRSLGREHAVTLGSDAIPPAALEHRKVEVSGRFDPDGVVLLDNRMRQGAVGYEVIMPLLPDAGGLPVLVNRGWIVAGADRRVLPSIRTPHESVRITGRALVPGRRFFELSGEVVEGRVWQNLTIERYQAIMQRSVRPIMLLQLSDLTDGLVRDWPAPDSGADVNRSYAVQWFGMAALIAVIYLVLSFRRVPD